VPYCVQYLHKTYKKNLKYQKSKNFVSFLKLILSLLIVEIFTVFLISFSFVYLLSLLLLFVNYDPPYIYTRYNELKTDLIMCFSGSSFSISLNSQYIKILFLITLYRSHQCMLHNISLDNLIKRTKVKNLLKIFFVVKHKYIFSIF